MKPIRPDAEDRLLLRKLYVQNYSQHVFDAIQKNNKAGDRRLLTLLSDFLLEASDRELLAFSRQRNHIKPVGELLARIKEEVARQKDETLSILNQELDQFVLEVPVSLVNLLVRLDLLHLHQFLNRDFPRLQNLN